MIERAFPASGLNPVALLVDGENLPPSFADAILKAAALFGVPTVRRVYGKAEHLAGWHLAGFRPVPTHPGKNAADLLLCVEAMSLALRDAFRTIVIASSDCDFTHVATHLRELGHRVVGMGEAKAPATFRAACSDFVVLGRSNVPAAEATTSKTVSQKKSERLHPNRIIPPVRDIIAKSIRPDGMATVPFILQHLTLRGQTFDPADYGAASLEALLSAVGHFTLEQAEDSKVLVRDPFRKTDPARLAIVGVPAPL